MTANTAEPDEFVEEVDRLFAARSWSKLVELVTRDAHDEGSWSDALRALVHVGRLAQRTDELESRGPRPYCLPLLLETVDAAWLLVNLRQETITYKRRRWEPAGHYALHLVHRTFEVLLGAYLGFEFALGRDKPDKTPNAVTRRSPGRPRHRGRDRGRDAVQRAANGDRNGGRPGAAACS